MHNITYPEIIRFIKTSGHSAKCTGCGNIVHCLDLETAICPLCAYEQSKENK